MWRHLLFDLVLATSAPNAPTPAVTPATPPAATTPPATKVAPPWLGEVARRFDLYGRFDEFLGYSKDGVELTNNGSRFGFRAEQKLPGDLLVLGHAEWSVKLGEGETRYNVSENPDTGLATVDSTTNQAITTRLGYVGLRFSSYGTLTLGKQWGVYYDVSQWTDRYTVFGARGSSTFNAGTDGGQTGEGRANDALVYRVAFGPVQVGVQAQFLDARDETLDGVGASLVVDLGSGLRVGAAYSHAFFDFGNIVGYDGGDGQAFTSGLTFDGGGWTIGALQTWTHNHEFIGSDAAVVAYDTLGTELFVARRFERVLMPYVGLDLAIPRGLDTRFVDPNFGNRDVLGGVRWLFDDSEKSYVYAEGRFGQTTDTTGERVGTVVTTGIRLEYSLRRALGLEG